jgi:vesicle coat complex subunit
MVQDPYSSMIRLLAVNLATDGLFDNIVREKVEMMRDSDPDVIQRALRGIALLNDTKRN